MGLDRFRRFIRCKVTCVGWVFSDFWETATVGHLGNLCLAASQDTQEKRSKISYQELCGCRVYGLPNTPK